MSSDKGVASITFDTTMTSHGAGIGATEAQLMAAYPNLQKAVGPNYTHYVKADDNPGVSSSFRVANGKVEAAFTSAPGNNCHN
ncbi:hypothetical protein BBK82_14035 [Lentzea guizhouensis]|uniref:Uncharacterized protein n=1 Tax=Lentzea guizhouensis TaxID=1586287 RepID=A0A1B2HH24_9PSEU|nr:hypothetical protein [Lentzea guizhouensis]ANZ37022.1 hypothetical protein BBK82_14035 [Lentzea guizhouensis]